MVLKNIFQGIATVLLLLNNSCSKEKFPLDANGLTHKGKFVYNNQFSMNGIYYMNREAEGGYAIRYFFQDGFYFASGTQEEVKVSIDCIQIHPNARKTPYNWGCFIIEGDTLKVQTFDPTSRERYHEFRVEERWAKIENDSTIRFFKKITPEKKELELNEIFQYKYCKNKPDSTNILMKY